jgi:hypothetical protein
MFPTNLRYLQLNYKLIMEDKIKIPLHGFCRLKSCNPVKAVFLDFVHHLYFNKITTFRKLDLLPSSGKKEGQKP